MRPRRAHARRADPRPRHHGGSAARRRRLRPSRPSPEAGPEWPGNFPKEAEPMGRHLGRLLIVALASVLLAACATSSSSGVPASRVPASGPTATRPASAPGVVATATPAASDAPPARRAAHDPVPGPGRGPRQGRGRRPVRDPAGARGSVGLRAGAGSASASRSSRRSPPSREPDPLFAIAGGPGDAEHAVLRLAPGPLRGRPRHP